MRRPLIVHPFLFALFPALSLVSDHIEILSLDATVLAIAILSLILALLFLLCLNLVVKDRQKAAFIVSLSLLMFFSYGHTFDFVARYAPGPTLRHRHLLLAWGMLAFAMIYFSLKSRTEPTSYTRFLNIMAISLVGISFAHIVTYEFAARNDWRPGWDVEFASTEGEGTEDLPDIYYIILDAHASTTTLREIYSYDNREFVESLAARGFFIANKSRSNYAMTTLSLASSLNMDYLDSLSSSISAEQTSLEVPKQMIEQNFSMQYLKSRGYRVVFFGSGYGVTYRNRYADQDVKCGYVDETVGRLIQSSLLRALADRSHFIENDQRNRALCTFSELARVHDLAGPVFVFAHIVPPQWPFLFDEDGNPVHFEQPDSRQQMRAYVDQLAFIDKKVVELVDEILTGSEVDPIIIIQSDHGPAFGFGGEQGWLDPIPENLRERMRILNAYHLPGLGDGLLYEAITPVNTFRMIFNFYFDTEFPLLEDQSYFSNFDSPFRFINVTETVKYD